MARAKNTSRAEARRRTREIQRADLTAADAAAGDETDGASSTADARSTDAPAPRTKLFTLPNVREDLRALPTIFLTRRLLLLPLLLLLGGVVLGLVAAGLPSPLDSAAALYTEFFFTPPALFVFFIAGFVAPRAAYLVGAIYGLIAAVAWSAYLLIAINAGIVVPTSDTPIPDASQIVVNYLVVGVIYGTLAAAFAAWYRDFLRGMQDRGRQRRAEQEAKERTKRRDERQESRRIAKQRPTS